MTSPLSPATTGASADGARPVPPLVVLIGPTASGKSSLAIQLARSLDASGHPAEIVNGDSMAIYAGMDIGTAKPSASDRALVPHHLVDVLEVTQTSTVADFQQLAREVIARLRSSGRIPILVGGSSLYVRAVIDDFEFPGTDPQVRARWERELAAHGAAALYEELVRRAPQARVAIEPANSRRIVRALEVLELTGHYSPHLPPPHYLLVNVHQFGLVVDREEMDRRIEERVHAMFDAGLVDEVRRLEGRGLRRGVTAARALGYQQVLAMLDGQLDQQGAIRATIDGTRRFARKQLGWFRRDPRIEWLPADGTDLPQRIAARLFAPDGGH
ncbi:tRNA (adenosine(37)-N6)-dimethylallyltransferase MiaA [Propionibacterium freudenreichii]|uniref:tRNA (adenosine(37)-N6)-dimethylallyltransferase MiaA n=1 Tax=Propionibacterium freudenreichii TaxID=1744 RepID=UPI0005A5C6B8|nr:tRNA (adenosine(37)-N6)-dimethylallyltransferase MiaA [Propionibacterium freudenreichii]MDK9330899.1 tRNA (adenosine(37)-N6)-dimethylallyltransferase MiaA [Propionibacterium freudenreichii]MDK9663097.1 tRNA (adenosine(37)-N6)-dimethylallyltransferase MiaA [Propionibacterium freudenreichii]CEI48887.1 TRNA isopentenyltransferase [Propionibacterium freudenreichii]